MADTIAPHQARPRAMLYGDMQSLTLVVRRGSTDCRASGLYCSNNCTTCNSRPVERFSDFRCVKHSAANVGGTAAVPLQESRPTEIFFLSISCSLIERSSYSLPFTRSRWLRRSLFCPFIASLGVFELISEIADLRFKSVLLLL